MQVRNLNVHACKWQNGGMVKFCRKKMILICLYDKSLFSIFLAHFIFDDLHPKELTTPSRVGIFQKVNFIEFCDIKIGFKISICTQYYKNSKVFALLKSVAKSKTFVQFHFSQYSLAAVAY